MAGFQKLFNNQSTDSLQAHRQRSAQLTVTMSPMSFVCAPSLADDMLQVELDLFGIAQDAWLFELAQVRGGGVELELAERLESTWLDQHHLQARERGPSRAINCRVEEGTVKGYHLRVRKKGRSRAINCRVEEGSGQGSSTEGWRRGVVTGQSAVIIRPKGTGKAAVVITIITCPKGAGQGRRRQSSPTAGRRRDGSW